MSIQLFSIYKYWRLIMIDKTMTVMQKDRKQPLVERSEAKVLRDQKWSSRELQGDFPVSWRGGAAVERRLTVDISAE